MLQMSVRQVLTNLADEWGYDWRLSPDILSRKFLEFVGNNCDEQPFIIAHSLGGLITRHAVNQHPHLFAGVLYAGTPQAAVNILGPLRNGDAVGFNKNILTAQVNFSIRTSFVFLPLDGKCFIDKNTKEEYDVNFFDVAQWEQYRLSPCIKRPLPALNPRSTLSAKFSSFGKRSSTSAVKPDMGAQNDAMNPATAVTIPYEKALPYLDRTLKKTRIFKEELRHVFMHQEYDRYPPHAVLYGKDTPTVLGAKVDGRHGIECADAYDDLAFASGDGVVLAKMAQLPAGYVAARGGVVATDKGHVSLLSDLEAVGKCLNALITARREGVGAIFTPY